MISYVFGSLDPSIIAVSIPIIVICGGVIIAIVAILMHARKKELVHKERLIAMEKGIELPAEPNNVKPRRPAYVRNRNNGLVMISLGITLMIAMHVAGGWIAGVWGLVPLGIGVALLVGSHLERSEVSSAETAPPTE